MMVLMLIPVKAKRRTKRTLQFKVMMSTEERLALEMMANDKGLSASDLVRQWVREAAKQRVA